MTAANNAEGVGSRPSLWRTSSVAFKTAHRVCEGCCVELECFCSNSCAKVVAMTLCVSQRELRWSTLVNGTQEQPRRSLLSGLQSVLKRQLAANKTSLAIPGTPAGRPLPCDATWFFKLNSGCYRSEDLNIGERDKILTTAKIVNTASMQFPCILRKHIEDRWHKKSIDIQSLQCVEAIEGRKGSRPHGTCNAGKIAECMWPRSLKEVSQSLAV